MTTLLPETQLGPAERLLDVVLNGSAHLWHNRPGVEVNGVWQPRRRRVVGTPVKPGLFAPAAVQLYERLLEIYGLNQELMARFASYALRETDWRDLKVACCALMLVQGRHGEAVRDDDGTIAFHDDDYREVGEAMLLYYEKKSTRMLTPKAVLRVAELLELDVIADLNRMAGFGDASAKKPPLGRYKSAVSKWLRFREQNVPMLQGLSQAGFKETIKRLARKVGYKPESAAFFAALGWKQKQAAGGHREIGLGELELQKRERFDGLSEVEICEAIEQQKLKYKDVVGRLPQEIGLTPAIMVALLPSLSDRDIRMMTPTLEQLGLLADIDVRNRWEAAIATATDQRALHIAKNVRSKAVRDKLEEAADVAARKAVEEVADANLHVMFLIDKSGSMEGAIEQSKEALTRILAGISLDRLHVVAFDTMGTVLKPKAANRVAVQHMLAPLTAGGGTMYACGVQALANAGVRIPDGAKLVVIAVGDEWGESGQMFARSFQSCGYHVAALALFVNVASHRGTTVRDAARALGVPFSEVKIAEFDDPYQVPRVLKALLDAPRLGPGASFGLVERIMKTPILTLENIGWTTASS